MYSNSSFDSLWDSPEHFELPEEQPDLCPFAKRFSEWAEQLCIKAGRDSNLVSINQAKVLLLDKYFEWRNVVPKSHRNRIGAVGHTCIFHVFEKAYESLKVLELALTPPMLFIPPPPPPPPPPPQIAGIFLGELDR